MNKIYMIKGRGVVDPAYVETSVVIAEWPEQARVISSVGRNSDAKVVVVEETGLVEAVELMFSSGTDLAWQSED